jgi:protein-S-isoprenylcysteine O-methyltransferase Ste14
MTLQEDFVKTGNWLFRWRSYLPLIFISLVLVGLRDFEYMGNSEVYDDWWELFCLMISFIGLGVRAYTVGHAPLGTSGRNTQQQVAESLITTGIYSATRNPLYLANFVHTGWIALIYMLVFFLYYERIIFEEEAFLQKKFGEAYLAWAGQTPFFFPKFKRWTPPNLPFSFKTVLKREYSSWFGLISVFTLFEVVGDLFLKGRFIFELGWAVLFFTGLILFVVLRVLKKKTDFLSVEGR